MNFRNGQGALCWYHALNYAIKWRVRYGVLTPLSGWGGGFAVGFYSPLVNSPTDTDNPSAIA